MPTFVNGECLPEAAIDYELQRLIQFYAGHLTPQALKNERARLRQQAKDQAIGTLLLRREAESLDLVVSESDIDDRVRRMIESAGGREAFEGVLRQQHLTLPALRDSIRNGRRVDLLVERLTGGCPDPTEQEIGAFFATNADEYRTPPSCEVQHILIRPASGGEADRAVARSKLQELRSRIVAGEAEFESAAAAHSDCPSGKRTGGRLGRIVSGAMIPALDEAIFALPAGEVSDILESPLGLHILRKADEIPGGPADLDDVREKIRELLRRNARGQVLSAHVDELRAKASVEEHPEPRG